MTPIFERFTSPIGMIVEEFRQVRPHSREQRHVVRAHRHIDRVDLHQFHIPVEGAQVPDVDVPGWTSFPESLGGQRNPASLGDAERSQKITPVNSSSVTAKL